MGDRIEVVKGYTRSLDYSSHSVSSHGNAIIGSDHIF